MLEHWGSAEPLRQLGDAGRGNREGRMGPRPRARGPGEGAGRAWGVDARLHVVQESVG